MLNELIRNFCSSIIDKSGAKCYKKSVKCLRRNQQGAATHTKTLMSAKTINGTSVNKSIEIDDITGKVNEEIIAEARNCHLYKLKGCNITGYRCAEMVVMAITMMYGTPKKVGFIGTGKTNLLSMIAIEKRFNINQFVIRGSKRNLIKNIGEFLTVSNRVIADTSEDMRELNSCDVVIECCNNCDESELIQANELSEPKLIIALDCGFLLGETFREERENFCDWPEQLEAHYKEEFVFDKNFHKFKQMSFDHEKYDKATVYLYGTAIADAVGAEKIIRVIEKNGMGEPFLIG